MNEHDLYRKIAEQFPKGHVQRIETSTGSGVPDINICYLGMEAWVEAKMVIPGGVILRKEQFAWGMRRAQAGGMAAVLAAEEAGDLFYYWKFPDIQVTPWHRDDKYVKILNQPNLISQNLTHIKKFLFLGAL